MESDRIVFKKIVSPEPAAAYVFEALRDRLAAGQSVLWLVAGGSAIGVAVLTAAKLREGMDLTRLTVTLTDERWGSPGHPNSNWRQLDDKGFRLPGAQLWPVLRGKNLTETAAEYGEFLTEAINKCDYSLALAGMGPDGHIFGVLPGSPAIQSDKAVVGYEWQDYWRLTPTPRFIRRLDEVVIYATGEAKWPQIAKLKETAAVTEQPAQLLKQLPKVLFFNDFQGEVV